MYTFHLNDIISVIFHDDADDDDDDDDDADDDDDEDERDEVCMGGRSWCWQLPIRGTKTPLACLASVGKR